MNNKKFVRNKEGIVRDSSDDFLQKIKEQKIKDDFRKNGIIIEPDWPKFPEYDYTKLMRLVFKIIEELKDLEIRFVGVGIGLDFNKPMFIVYLPRCSRGEPVPLEFEGLKVSKVVQGKFNFV